MHQLPQNVGEENAIPVLIPIQQAPVQDNDHLNQETDPVEEIVQAVVNPVEDQLPAQAENVLAMDDLTDASEDEVLPPQPLAQPVEVVEFPNMQNLPAFEVEEVQIEDLVEFANLGHPDQGPSNEVVEQL